MADVFIPGGSNRVRAGSGLAWSAKPPAEPAMAPAPETVFIQYPDRKVDEEGQELVRVPPAEPLSNDKATFFPPAAATPLGNSDTVIAKPYVPLRSNAAAPVPISSAEVAMGAAGRPVTNEVGAAVVHRSASGASPVASEAVIYPDEPGYPLAGLASSPPALPNGTLYGAPLPPSTLDVTFFRTGGGAPITNERSAGVVYEPHVSPMGQPSEPAPLIAIPVVHASGGVISNERSVTFIPSPIERPAFTPDGSDVFVAASAGLVQGGATFNPDALVLPPGSGGTINVDTDRSIGGGGDPTKQAGTGDVSFGGVGTLNASAEAVMSEDKRESLTAGAEDKHLTPAGETSLGNQESFAGASGEPVLSSDFRQVYEGAFGTPLKRNVT